MQISLRDTELRRDLLIGAALVVAAYVAGVWLKWPALQSLFPIGDELSIVAESSTPSLQWLTSGYSRYFTVYPEYWQPFTNFIRPVTNAVYAAFSCTGCFQLQFAVVNVGVPAVSTGLLYVLSRRMANTGLYSAAVAGCAFLAPAFWASAMAVTPGAAFDGVAAVQVVAAIWLASAGRWKTAIAVLGLAILTKEASLPVVAAFVAYAVFQRDWRVAAGAMTLLLMWASLRALAFGSSVGIYVFGAPLTVPGLLSRGSVGLWLPVTFGSFIPLRAALRGVLPEWPMLVVILANAGALVGGAAAAAIGLRQPVQTNAGAQRRVMLTLSALSVVSSGAFFVVVGGGVRFSYVFYLSFLMMLIAAGAGPWRRVASGLVMSALLVSALDFLGPADDAARVTRFQHDGARQLTAALRSITTERTLYIANDFVSGFSKAESVVKVAGARMNAQRGSSIVLSGCGVGEINTIRSTVEARGGGVVTLTTVLPDCASFLFEGADPRRLGPHLHGTHLARNAEISYDFSAVDAVRRDDGELAGLPSWGPLMIVTVRHADLLYYDFQKGEWLFVDSR